MWVTIVNVSGAGVSRGEIREGKTHREQLRVNVSWNLVFIGLCIRILNHKQSFHWLIFMPSIPLVIVLLAPETA